MEPALLCVVGIALGCAALLNAGARLAWALLASAIVFAVVVGDPFRLALAAQHFAEAATAPAWRLVPLLCWLAALLDETDAPSLARASSGAVVLALLADALSLPWLDLLVAGAVPLLSVVLLRALWSWIRDPQPVRARVQLRGPAFALGLWRTLALGLWPIVVGIALALALLWSGRASPAESAALAAFAAGGSAWLRGALTVEGLQRSASSALHSCGAIAAVWLGALCFEAALRDAGIDSLSDAALALLGAGRAEVALGVLVSALVLGAAFHASEVALVLVPLAAPVAAQVGIDRLWLGAALALVLHASALPALSGPGRRDAPRAARLAFPSLVAVAMFRWPELVHWLPELVLS